MRMDIKNYIGGGVPFGFAQDKLTKQKTEDFCFFCKKLDFGLWGVISSRKE
jgi:hypothetical protein